MIAPCGFNAIRHHRKLLVVLLDAEKWNIVYKYGGTRMLDAENAKKPTPAALET
jgi:hypothetical protein